MDFIVVKVRGLIIKDGKVFLCKLKQGGFYCLPGGTLEKGESLVQCLEREIIEELGVKPIIGKFIHYQEFFRENGDICIDFWFSISNINDYFSIDLEKASHGFELNEVGFYDLNIIDNYKPINLISILNKIK